MLNRFTNNSILRAAGGDNDDGDGNKGEGRGRNVPKGFEKFLKRTRRGFNHDGDKDGEKPEAA